MVLVFGCFICAVFETLRQHEVSIERLVSLQAHQHVVGISDGLLVEIGIHALIRGRHLVR